MILVYLGLYFYIKSSFLYNLLIFFGLYKFYLKFFLKNNLLDIGKNIIRLKIE